MNAWEAKEAAKMTEVQEKRALAVSLLGRVQLFDQWGRVDTEDARKYIAKALEVVDILFQETK